MKCVQEFELKFYPTYLDALLNEKYVCIVLEIENNTLPSSISIEIDGEMKNYRLKSFKRQTQTSNYLENVYILMT
jgi:hypothetical protein